MNSSSAIRKHLASIAADFPSVRLRYQYDELAQTHMVEVSPAYLYEIDDNFKCAQAEVIDQFTQMFPAEGLCFIGPNDIVGIEREHEIFHGFWSNILVTEPLTFTWPTGFVPGSHQVNALSWFDNFPSLGLPTANLHGSLVHAQLSSSFSIELDAYQTDRFDAGTADRKHQKDDFTGPMDYALAA